MQPPMQPPRIRILDDQTINKIAAGEVIENPSSVVKELVENALDAGSTEICVEIQEGGRQLIRISDNGCGMSHDDALLSLERHATSKIRDVNDIEELLTMGFRGEAIPSIAAISKFSLLTCIRSEENNLSRKGSLIIVEGGKILSCGSATRSPGTTIEVKSLFFNVPVRRKFQKSPSFDTQEIVKVLNLLALANPFVQFELIGDQKTLFKTIHANGVNGFHETLGKRVESILGKGIFESLLPVSFQHDSYEVEGFIGQSHLHRPNRTGQYLFINQRPVYSPLVSTAVREGYGPMLPTSRFPVFILHIRMPGTLLDVNVHPQKKEVRMRQEFQLKDAIIRAVQASLRREQKQQDSPFPQLPVENETSPPPFWGSYSPFPSRKSNETSLSAMEEPWEFKPYEPEFVTSTEEILAQKTDPIFPMPPVSIQSSPSLLNHSRDHLKAPRVIATLVGYLLIDPFDIDPRLFRVNEKAEKGGLALVNQQAAYSRIHYEKLLKRSESAEIQPLLIPLTLQLPPEETRIVLENLSLLNEMGFGIREFGEHTLMVDALPLFIKPNQLATTLSLLLHDFVEMQSTRRMQLAKEEQLALAASRASIPSTKQLSMEEAQGLMEQLIGCTLPGQCPMGRPVCVYFSPQEMGKWYS